MSAGSLDPVEFGMQGAIANLEMVIADVSAGLCIGAWRNRAAGEKNENLETVDTQLIGGGLGTLNVYCAGRWS